VSHLTLDRVTGSRSLGARLLKRTRSRGRRAAAPSVCPAHGTRLLSRPPALRLPREPTTSSCSATPIGPAASPNTALAARLTPQPWIIWALDENAIPYPSDDWPGVHCVPELERGDGKLYGTWYERTAEYRQTGRTDSADPRFQTQETIELSPIPAWEHLPRKERAGRVKKLLRKIRQEVRERRKKGIRCLGREAILRQNPHDRPKRSKRSPAPIVHAVAKHVRYLMMENRRDFLRRYRLASDRWRAGLEAEFPEDCFPPARPWMPARASPG